jgi:hypothetical protein
MSLRSIARATRAGAALAMATVALAAVPAGAAPSAPARAADVQFGLVSQQFDVDPAGVFVADLSLPDGIAPADLTTATLVVTAYGRVTDRAGVTDALSGELSRVVDSVQLPLAGMPSNATADIEVVVPIETTTRTPQALQLTRAGLYPIVIELTVDGEVFADLTTFLHRIPAAGEAAERPLQVAVAMSTTSPVVLDDATDPVIDEASMAELAHLADVLEASPLPIAVRVPPAVVAGLGFGGPSGSDLAARLMAALDGDDLLSSPLLPLDPSAAAAAGQQSLYTQWLRDGEDGLAAIANEPAVRTVTLLDHPISADGGALARDMGARLFVLTPELFTGLLDPSAAFTDVSGLVDVRVAGGAMVPATVVDGDIADILQQGAAEPALTAVVVAAELLAVREGLAAAGEDPSRHGITIGTATLGLPDTATMGAVATLLATTEGLTPVHLDTLGLGTDPAEGPGGTPITVTLPASVPGSIAERIQLTASLAQEATNTGSMLPEGAARPAEWSHLIGRLPSDGLTDTQVAAIAAGLRAEFASIRAAVQVQVPAGSRFTLTGRSSTVRVKIGNSGTTPLTVQVRLGSPKLLFPDGPQTVVLEPGQFTEVRVRVEARTNGTSAVTLEVYTADGGLRLGPIVPLAVSVNALSGLGNLVTGALALVLLTWWVRHVRQNRRARATTGAVGRHPVNGTRSDAPALSPDAETSTLPPS